MGWASGSAILQEVADAVMDHIPKSKRRAVAEELIEIFENADCDTINEVDQEDIQAEYLRRNPSDEDEDDEWDDDDDSDDEDDE